MIHFNDEITVHDDRGDLYGRAVGRDGECYRVMIYRDKSAQWFADQHTSRIPHIWVDAAKIINGGVK